MHHPNTSAPPMQPLGDRLLVKPLEASERVVGGVIIPDVAQEKPQQGIVIAVGAAILTAERAVELLREYEAAGDVQIGYALREAAGGNAIELGCRVLYSKYAGSEISIDGVDYLVVREADCLGILPPLSDEELELETAITEGGDGTSRLGGRDTNNLEL